MSESAPRRAAAEYCLGAPAVYYYDVAHDGRPRLVLAYLVELVLPPWRALGLLARTELTADELACMDAIGRHLFSRPFDYLQQECERIRRCAPAGHALADLSAAHYAALQIAPPRECPMPPIAATSDRSARAVLAGVTELLQPYEALDRPVAVVTLCDPI